MITSSAILPTDHLDQAVNELSNMLPQELEPLLRNISYRDVVSTQSSTDEQPRRGGAAHRRLQTELSMNHPTIWKFIDSLKTVQ